MRLESIVKGEKVMRGVLVKEYTETISRDYEATL